MPKEQKLLKQLVDSLNKQPKNESSVTQDSQPKQTTDNPVSTAFPLRSLDEILKEQRQTKQE